MLNMANLITIVTATIVLCYAGKGMAVTDKAVNNAEAIYNVAKELELNEGPLTGERLPLLKRFARAPTADISERYYEVVLREAATFLSEGNNYLQTTGDPTQSRGVWSFFKRNPFSQWLSSVKDNPFLTLAVQRYIALAKETPLVEADYKCDSNKFKIDSLGKILFMLSTDVKYLLTERSDIMSDAIYEYLENNKFVASHNFFEEPTYNEKQMDVVRGYVLNHSNLENANVGQLIDRIMNPSDLVMGRLYKTCEILEKYTHELNNVKGEAAEVCTQSKIQREPIALDSDLPEMDDDEYKFCKEFMELEVD